METADVVAAAHLCDPATVVELKKACAAESVSFGVWTPPAPAPAGATAKVIVAGLPAGARSVPTDVQELVGAVARRARVLLVSSEATARPGALLHGGRVAVLGPAPDTAQLQLWLRKLISDTTDDDGSKSQVASTGGRWYQRTHWCAGTVGSAARPRAALPLVVDQGALGATIIIPTPGSPVPGPSTVAAVSTRLRDDDTAVLERTLPDLLARQATVIHLNRSTKRWTFLLSQGAPSLWLVSPTRVPLASNLVAAQRTDSPPLLRFPARIGDVVVAWSGPVGDDKHWTRTARLTEDEAVKSDVAIILTGGAREFHAAVSSSPSTEACAVVEML